MSSTFLGFRRLLLNLLKVQRKLNRSIQYKALPLYHQQRTFSISEFKHPWSYSPKPILTKSARSNTSNKYSLLVNGDMEKDANTLKYRKNMDNQLLENSKIYLQHLLRKKRILPSKTQTSDSWTIVNKSSHSEELPLCSKPSDQALSFPGILNIPGLHQPSDIPILVEKCQIGLEEIIQSIKSDNLTLSQFVLALDQISTKLCDLVDVLEFLRNTHESSSWRKAFYENWIVLQQILASFSANEIIANKLSSILTNQYEFENCSVEERRILTKMSTLIDNATAHDSAKEHILALTTKLYALEQEFYSNIDASCENTVLDARVEDILAYAPELKGLVFQKGTNVIVSLDSYTVNTIQSKVPNRNIRRQVYLAFSRAYFQNIPVLGQIIALKQEHVGTLDFKSFTHLTQQVEVAKSPENVVRFLDHLFTYLKPILTLDLMSLRDQAEVIVNSRESSSFSKMFSRFSSKLSFLNSKPDVLDHQSTLLSFPEYTKENSKLVQGGILGPSRKSNIDYPHGLEAWDIDFVRSVIKDANELNGSEEYFSYFHCLEGLQLLCKEVFSLELIPSPMLPSDLELEKQSESWAPNAHIAGHDNLAISKFELCDLETKEHYGTFYLDLFDRPGKLSAAATFTVRTGKIMDSHCSSLSTGETVEENAYRKAVVAIMTSYTPTIGETLISHNSEVLKSSSMVFLPSSLKAHDGSKIQFSELENLTPEQQRLYSIEEKKLLASYRSTLLSYDAYTTLLHEFGHALNGLLSRTRYQNLSGVRYELDFVETPSMFMENFALEPAFLRRICKHYATDMPIPEDMIYQLISRNSNQKALNILSTLTLSAIDQRLYGIPADFNEMKVFPWVSNVDVKPLSSTIITNKENYDETVESNYEKAFHQLLQEELIYVTPSDPIITNTLDPNNTSYVQPSSSYPTPDYVRHLRKNKHIPDNVIGKVDLKEPRFSYLFGEHNSKIINQILHNYSITPPIKDMRMPHASDTHLLNYPGSCYTYLYCEIFARAIYMKLFENPFNKESGKIFRKYILSTAGSHFPLFNLALTLGIIDENYVNDTSALPTSVFSPFSYPDKKQLSIQKQNDVFNLVMKNFVLYLQKSSAFNAKHDNK